MSYCFILISEFFDPVVVEFDGFRYSVHDILLICRLLNVVAHLKVSLQEKVLLISRRHLSQLIIVGLDVMTRLLV